MKVISSRNPNWALNAGLQLLRDGGIEESSRNGRVLVYPTPVTTVTLRPRERVVFSQVRDANPYFHVMEALWMLAGRNDVAFPAHFAKQLQLYSDDNFTLNGAYGYRWREHFNQDQLEVIIEELRANPDSRRCVLTMWDGHRDLESAIHGSKDVPCNTQVYFRARKLDHSPERLLDMTVTCRSNDAVWGAHGANVVHFGFLLEYVAMCLGLGVGSMYQVSNNYHVYADRPDVVKLLASNLASSATNVEDYYPSFQGSLFDPIIERNASWKGRQHWRDSVNVLIGAVLNDHTIRDDLLPSRHQFLTRTVVPMIQSHRAYKAGNVVAAFEKAQAIGNPDWCRACIEWLRRRPSMNGKV